MIRGVLVDTGPLVALINRRDQYHSWVQSTIADILPPLLTCEPVLTEACYLARRTAAGPTAILELVERGTVRLAFDLDDNFAEVSALVQRYADIPMSLADACMVRMSEVLSGPLLTVDSDFHVYRRHRRERLLLLIPPDA